jgi:hypothetical protein
LGTFAVAIVGSIACASTGCGGAKDSGLFGGSTDSGATDSGAGKDSALPPTGDDDDQPDATPPSGDDTTDDAATPVDSAPPPPECPTADPTQGEVSVDGDNVASYVLGVSTWAQNGQNGADNMQADYGAKCDGETTITVFNHTGTFDVTKRMVQSVFVEGPVITFQTPLGTKYVAGYSIADQCSPCGSGTITVSDWANGKASGTFDVRARRVGSGQERRFTGKFSFHH